MTRMAGGHSPRSLGAATRRWAAAFSALLAAAPAAAQLDPPSWTRPIAPVPLIGPITYVGTEGLAAYLIRTDAGAILIDATMEQNVPSIARNIVASGVPLRQVKLILVSHAHFDHVAGLAAMKRATGAKVVAGTRDAAALESGTPPGETDYGIIRFPAVTVDRRVRDGDRVRLGKVVLRAVATPGHTPGCTTWTMRIVDRGRARDVVFPCSISVAGNRLIGNRRYPTIVTDFRGSFARLAALPADVVLPAHPEGADVFARQRAGTLVAPGLLRTMVLKSRDDFDRELAKQAKAAQAGTAR
ncbi:subclass B3 metallo-beta-lactamase [Sphingomonas sp. Leaf412]|uniref:subclass B3 metallo-beta-lactamase n=1 Tax=Sphingomonas sp. Leaf412 TaxID=1736370 RepID=UPI000ADDF872|nr:subclass B3 metallo-beta-lactamase [Sphingomonas sp. Leaf412]